MTWLLVFAAYITDLIVGDPKHFSHPVVLIGKGITFLDKHLNKPGDSIVKKRFMGFVIVFIEVFTAMFITWLLVVSATELNPVFGKIVTVMIISGTIATRGLMKSANEIASLLAVSNVDQARGRVAMIVGRDTADMKSNDVARATIETVAENLVDGIIAPVIFALIGGAPLAMAYRAINTLDSMIGYKNDEYEDFGWAAARLDDIVNYIPARLSVVIVAIATIFYRGNAVNTLRTVRRFAKNHASPNSGWPEAAIAGAFDLRLGGTNYYNGIPRETGYIGDGSSALNDYHIKNAVKLIFVSSCVTVVLSGVVYGVLKATLHFKV